MDEFLSQVYFKNTVYKYIEALGTFLICILLILIIRNLILKKLIKWRTKKTGKEDTKLSFLINKYIFLAMYLAAFYVSINILIIPPILIKIVNILTMALSIYLAVVFITSFLENILQRYSEKNGDDSSRQLAFHWIIKVLKGLIWIIAVILFLQNIGIEIGALVTGLGIGGVAIAFAAQTILSEIFSYFTIFFDRPFEVGDYINIGEFSGTVEHIGLRTTKLRSIGGEQLIFSNKDLTNSRVKNFKRMEERRVAFSLCVIMDTPNEKLKQIPNMIKEAIETQENTQFERAHFAAYTDFGLRFDIVYRFLNSDYNQYMDTQQEINYKIKEFFENNQIELAYPTQTVLINGITKQD